MRLALDTNRYVDLCRGDADIVARVSEAECVFVPFVVVGELRAGFALGDRPERNERVLARFLAKPGTDVLYATDATTRTYAAVYRQLRQQGTPIPTNVLWIAALVIERGLSLCSRDAHFRQLPQLSIV